MRLNMLQKTMLFCGIDRLRKEIWWSGSAGIALKALFLYEEETSNSFWERF